MKTVSDPMNADFVEQLHQWMNAVEGEHFEFKEAKNRFSSEDLAKNCCALANEGGGRVILGVTNARPRRVVGTRAFFQLEEIRRNLMTWIPLRIEVQEIHDPDGRVLVFEVPSRPIGVPLKYEGIYWSRVADQLAPLAEEELRLIFAETARDFSAEVCSNATFQDLDASAVENFRRRWMDKSGNRALSAVSPEQLLQDAELTLDDGITYAALILFGKSSSLGRHLAQAEIVFEYRSSEASGPAQHRKEFRQGFFSCYDEIWELINLRNDVQHYQYGLFVLDLPTLEERSVREAVLNAVSHRDYQLGGNVFLRQFPRRLVVESPGGFPPGITQENILDRQSPRNRRIADAFARCGLVERSGQGMNLMFEQSIRQGKSRPDFAGTDRYIVNLTLHGEVRDPRFVQFLERIGRETLLTFTTYDFLILDWIHREEKVPPEYQSRVRRLVDLGILEQVGRGKGTRHMLSQRFYAMVGQKGSYTRRKGLDHDTHKELLMKHLNHNPQGSPLSELHQVLPHLAERKVQSLLRELREEGRIWNDGTRRWARWKSAKG